MVSIEDLQEKVAVLTERFNTMVNILEQANIKIPASFDDLTIDGEEYEEIEEDEDSIL